MAISVILAGAITLGGCGNTATETKSTAKPESSTSATSSTTNSAPAISDPKSQAADLSYDGSRPSGNNPKQDQIKAPEIIEIKAGEETPEKFVEFARGYLNLLEYAQATGDSHQISNLSSPECKPCAGAKQKIIELHLKGKYTDPANVVTEGFEVGSAKNAKNVIVNLQVGAFVNPVYQNGKQVDEFKHNPTFWQLALTPDSNGTYKVQNLAIKQANEK